MISVSLLLFMLASGLIGITLYGSHETARDERTARRNAELVARADREHAQIMNDDERGIYGEYPPAV